MIELVIKMPVKSFNLNQITNVNRGNRYAGATAKKKAMQAIYNQIKDQIDKPLEGKYRVSAKWLVTHKNTLLKIVAFVSVNSRGRMPFSRKA